MKLSAEQFQGIIQSLRLDGGAFDTARRSGELRVRRVRLGGRATVIPCGGDQARRPVSAIARDISPSGIALTLPVQLSPGESFVLHVPASADGPEGRDTASGLLCKVVRFLPAGDGVFTIGATFTRELLGRPAAKTNPAARLAQIALLI